MGMDTTFDYVVSVYITNTIYSPAARIDRASNSNTKRSYA